MSSTGSGVGLAVRLGVALWAAVGCGGGEDSYEGPRVDVSVMTRNLYLGADISNVLLAPSVDAVPDLAAAFWAEVLRSDFPARAKLLAEEVALHAPDLLALQEVEIYRRQSPSDFATVPGVNASEVVLDFLAILQAELAARGLTYVVAVQNVLSDVELPVRLGTELVDLRMTDRDVTLAKPGVLVSEATTHAFASYLSLNVGGAAGPRVEIRRGYSTVAAVASSGAGTARFTFGNAHLEVGGLLQSFQEAQADELVERLRPVAGPVLLLGDFNSAADRSSTRSYGFLRTLFRDPWENVRPGDPGYTCCVDLAAGDPAALDSRIDLVLTRGDVAARGPALVGLPARTPGGLTASDHLGVVMTLSLVPDVAR